MAQHLNIFPALVVFLASLQAERIRILFLDLGSNGSTAHTAGAGTIACVTQSSVEAVTPVDHRIDDAELTALLQQTVKGAGWTWKDLTHLCCVTGPGGFTSLRVGAAAINALAFALDIPVAGIRLDALYEARAKGQPFVWLHSTKKTLVFHKAMPSDTEPQCLDITALPSVLTAGDAWAGELLPEHRVVVERAGLRELPISSLEHVLPGVLADRRYSTETLVPWYGRGW